MSVLTDKANSEYVPVQIPPGPLATTLMGTWEWLANPRNKSRQFPLPAFAQGEPTASQAPTSIPPLPTPFRGIPARCWGIPLQVSQPLEPEFLINK